MMDNSVGQVFPGAFLWTKPIKVGQLQQPNLIDARPPVTVTFTGLKEIPSNLPDAKTIATDSISLSHTGKYSDFEAKARPIFKANTAGGNRLSADFKVSYSFSTAVQKMGMSAKYFSNKFSIDDSSFKSSSESVALLTIDQVYYSAATDAPPAGGYLPDSIVQASPDLAASLDQGIRANGELAYVRKVDYGRRVLIAITSTASREKLERAMAASIKVFKSDFKGSLDKESEETWSSTHGKLIIIGGSLPEGIGATFGGDFSQFSRTVEAIMSKESLAYNPQAGAVPVSFEMAYVADNTPMQVFETVEFAGRIPVRDWKRKNQTDKIITEGRDAAVIHDDDEIHSDDFTLVRITKQNFRLSANRTTVHFDLEWQALEADDDKKTHHKTVIQSSKTFSYPFNKPIKSISTAAQQPVAGQWIPGENNSPISFPNTAPLSNIRIQFDGPGRGDHRKQSFTADLTFEVWAED